MLRLSLTCAAFLIAIVGAGCGDNGPDISTCYQGAFFADCEGEGAPRLGCKSGDCFWFVGGNVAAGYQASSCAEDNICCHNGEPFSDGSNGAPLYFWGKSPWDASRAMNIPVAEGSDLAVTDFTCSNSGQAPAQPGCPSGIIEESTTALTRDTVTIFLSRGGASTVGWTPVVEVDLATNTARVCTGSFTDTAGAGCPLNDYTECATDGTVRLSRSPTATDSMVGLLVEVDVNLGGRSISGTAVVAADTDAAYIP